MTALIALQAALLELAKGRRPSYRIRLRIERAVFGVLAGRLAVDAGMNVGHVSPALLEAVAELQRAGRAPEVAVQITRTGVRAVALLRELASFDPYVVAGDSAASAAPRPSREVIALSEAIQQLIGFTDTGTVS